LNQRNHCETCRYKPVKAPPTIARTMPDASGDINTTAVLARCYDPICGTCDIRATLRAERLFILLFCGAPVVADEKKFRSSALTPVLTCLHLI
jgi:hypothetical protein